jgi:DNA-binding transcriptional MocR family regulator
MLEILGEFIVDYSARGIADAVSQGIRTGRLEPGSKLPSIRSLAADLHVSPATVSAAWAVLTRAGLIHSLGRAGTVISERDLGPSRYRRASQYATEFQFNLSSGLPDQSLLPDLAPALRRLGSAEHLQSYLDQPVVPDLLALLHDTWPCAAEAITVADGVMDALDLIVNTFLRFGDRVGVESVTDPALLDLLEVTGAKPVAIEMDVDGVTVDSVRAALDQGIRAIFVQSRAQHPTGVAISAERSRRLAELLADSDVLVVEVDFVGSVSDAPDRSLAEYLPSRTIHIRGYSTSHGPELRLSAIGGPLHYLESLVQRRHLGQGWTSRLLQLVLLDLLRDNSVDTCIENARTTYRRRRNALVQGLSARGITAESADGLYVWVPVQNEAAALVNLASRGIGVAPGTTCAVGATTSPHICVTTGGLTVEHADLVADAIAASVTQAGNVSILRGNGARPTAQRLG